MLMYCCCYLRALPFSCSFSLNKVCVNDLQRGKRKKPINRGEHSYVLLFVFLMMGIRIQFLHEEQIAWKRVFKQVLKEGSVFCGSNDKPSSASLQSGESWWPCDEQGLCCPLSPGCGFRASAWTWQISKRFVNYMQFKMSLLLSF